MKTSLFDDILSLLLLTICYMWSVFITPFLFISHSMCRGRFVGGSIHASIWSPTDVDRFSTFSSNGR